MQVQWKHIICNEFLQICGVVAMFSSLKYNGTDETYYMIVLRTTRTQSQNKAIQNDKELLVVFVFPVSYSTVSRHIESILKTFSDRISVTKIM